MTDTIQVPDFIVKEVGRLQILLSQAQIRIEELEQEKEKKTDAKE